MKIDELIIDKIMNNKPDTFIVFFVSTCPYCRKTMDLLKERHLSYKGYNINSINGGMNKLLSVLRENAPDLNFDVNHRTKPVIFLNGVFLGGYNELVNFIRTYYQSNSHNPYVHH